MHERISCVRISYSYESIKQPEISKLALSNTAYVEWWPHKQNHLTERLSDLVTQSYYLHNSLKINEGNMFATTPTK